VGDKQSEEQPLDRQVLHRVEHRVAWITLNRPEVRNAITSDQRNRVIDLLEEASASLDVGAVCSRRPARGSARAPTCAPVARRLRRSPRVLPNASWAMRPA